MNKKAFSLVELIVVIIILAILGTIGFLTFQNYSSSSRDAIRISDIANIMKNLELYQSERGEYPKPDNGIVVYYKTGAMEVWTQGTVGIEVASKLDKLDKLPRDPLTGNEYTYSVLNTKEEYQVAATLEGGAIGLIDNKKINILPQVNAANGNILGTAYVRGNYNGQIVKVQSGTTTYVLAIPTIINGDMTLTDIIEIINNKKLVYNGYGNLPSSYSGTSFKIDGGFNYSQTGGIVVYSGSLEELKSDEYKRIELTKNLQDVYDSTIISNDGNIKKLLNTNIVLGTPSNESKLLADSIIRDKLDEFIKDDYNFGEIVKINEGPEGAPAIPSGLESTFQKDTKIYLNWDLSVNAESYGIYLDGTLIGYTPALGSVIDGLSPNTSYNIYITAKNSVFETDPSSHITVTTSPPPPLVTAIGANESQINVEWNSITGATSYNVYLDGIKQGEVSSTGGSFNGLNANTNYNITVESVRSEKSISSKSSILTFGTAPKAPTNLHPIHISNDSITLGWDHSPGASRYYVSYLTGGSWEQFPYYTTDNTISYEGLEYNSNYQYKVIALKSPIQYSSYSTEIVETTAPTTLATPVTNLRVSNITATSFHFKFDKLPSARKYYFYEGPYYLGQSDNNNQLHWILYDIPRGSTVDNLRVVGITGVGNIFGDVDSDGAAGFSDKSTFPLVKLND